MIARAVGPEIGGLFFAFPAILPASLTRVAQHDGRRQAADDARGAVLGALGLVTFAITATLLAPRCTAVVTLVAATGARLAVALASWVVVYGSRGDS